MILVNIQQEYIRTYRYSNIGDILYQCFIFMFTNTINSNSWASFSRAISI